jgi:AbrB family looped-hinge helix DNA binding protein
MQTTIDRAGRVVIPKQLRDRLRLTGGSVVDIQEHDGVIEIRLAPHHVSVDRSDGRPRLAAGEQVPALTDDDVREILDEMRR